MRTFDELLDDLEHRARWVPDEAGSVKTALRLMLAAAVAAERERCALLCESTYPELRGGELYEFPCFSEPSECAAAIRGTP